MDDAILAIRWKTIWVFPKCCQQIFLQLGQPFFSFFPSNLLPFIKRIEIKKRNADSNQPNGKIHGHNLTAICCCSKYLFKSCISISLKWKILAANAASAFAS